MTVDRVKDTSRENNCSQINKQNYSLCLKKRNSTFEHGHDACLGSKLELGFFGMDRVFAKRTFE